MQSSQPIEAGSVDAKRRVLIFHGYTGSPDSFRELAETIATTCNAHVSIPLLPGHGTTLDDLQNVSFDEFLSAARTEIEKATAARVPLVIIGYCFGGFLAAMLAAEYKPQALIIGLTPYAAKFPLGFPLVASFLKLFPTVDKFLHQDEVEMRKPFFYYPRIPGRSQEMVNDGIARMRKILGRLDMPILTMHTTEDPTVPTNSGKKILAASGHNKNDASHLLPNRRHALFFGPHKDEDIKIVIEFLKKNFA